ncbi:unnamed protein product [Lota lota]
MGVPLWPYSGPYSAAAQGYGPNGLPKANLDRAKHVHRGLKRRDRKRRKSQKTLLRFREANETSEQNHGGPFQKERRWPSYVRTARARLKRNPGREEGGPGGRVQQQHPWRTMFTQHTDLSAAADSEAESKAAARAASVCHVPSAVMISSTMDCAVSLLACNAAAAAAANDTNCGSKPMLYVPRVPSSNQLVFSHHDSVAETTGQIPVTACLHCYIRGLSGAPADP